MKKSLTSGFKCLKCFVIFYLVFICILGLGVGICATYLLIFREEGHIPKAKSVVLYFLVFPTILTVLSTILGCWSIKRKRITLLKFFAVLLAITAIVEIAGVIWCFVSLPEVNEEIKAQIKMKFANDTVLDTFKNWWDKLQAKLECCGLHGPTDYHSLNGIPFSCCGSDPKDQKTGSCSFVWQKGCSNALEKQIGNDLVLLGLMALCTAFLRIPGAFLTWCFAYKMSKDGL